MEQPMSTEVRSDYVGNYTAYLYADGHVETDPPGRPLAKEDVRRQRLREASRQLSQKLLQAQRTRVSRGSDTPAAIRRENSAAVTSRTLTSYFHETVDALSSTGRMARAPGGQLEQLSKAVSLGGEVVGTRKGERPEYSNDVLPIEERREQVWPTELPARGT